MIYVSFPRRPDDYAADCVWHAQLSHHVYHGLCRRLGHGKVEFVEWDQVIAAAPQDLIVTCLPNANYRTGARIIGVENDTLVQRRWTHSTFDCHGIEARVDDVRELFPLLRNAAGLLVMTHDVALARLAAGEADATGHVRRLEAYCHGNIHVGLHPIDRARFRRWPKARLNRQRWWTRRRHRMMVYHAGWRKNSAEAIAMMKGLGFREGKHFDVVDFVNKNDEASMKALVDRYNIVFSGSFSESGPINIIEYLIQGFVIAGHEAWWDGYGFAESVWSYDPSQADEMRRRLLWLMDEGNLPAMLRHRERIHSHFMEREDMAWDGFIDRLLAIIERAS